MEPGKARRDRKNTTEVFKSTHELDKNILLMYCARKDKKRRSIFESRKKSNKV